MANLNVTYDEMHDAANKLRAGRQDAPVPTERSVVVAHELTRLWMSTEFDVEWEETHYERRPRDAWPNRTFFTSDRQPLAIEFGGETVTYGHLLEAHTVGDIYVRFEQRNVIVAGGTGHQRSTFHRIRLSSHCRITIRSAIVSLGSG